MVDEKLKILLCKEAGGVNIPDGLFDRFIRNMDEITLKNKDVLIEAGKVDKNIYIQKSGIMRACYFDGESEKTYGFSVPGTVVISYHSHFKRLPSVFQIEACCETVVLKAPKTQLDEFVKNSPEFAQWIIGIHQAQIFSNEYKTTMISGLAKERYRLLLQNRPEIVEQVSSKLVASYLGITPVHLSRLKKQFKE